MAHSTSPALQPPDAFGDAARLATLARFYRWQARLYDWTRPLILFGRGEIVDWLAPAPGDRLLDVGCGTGWSLPRLVAREAFVTGVEPDPSMRAQARRRLARLPAGARVCLDPRPYGPPDMLRGPVEGVLFSYSLSMIPSFRQVIARAALDLRPGGRVAVVDFLDAPAAPVRSWLGACHVALGPDRLDALRRAFPRHAFEIRRGFGWRYLLFRGEAA